MNLFRKANIFIGDYFYLIDVQVVEIHDSDSNSDLEETHKFVVTKFKCIENTKVLHIAYFKRYRGIFNAN